LLVADPWLFRVASSPSVGSGHVARCRALAKQLNRHTPVCFALDDDGRHWATPLARDGFEILDRDPLQAHAWSGCLLDDYRLSAADVSAFKKLAGAVVTIDDFGTPPAAADLAINPAPVAMRVGAFPGIYLSGPQYALIDAAYAAPPAPVIRDGVGEILVSFGTFDKANATGLALAALAEAGLGAQVTVALGRYAPAAAQVRALLDRLEPKGRFLADVDDMLGLLRGVDLAIGGGGVSLLERMAVGVPSITVIVADNQRLSAEGAHSEGATLFAGSSNRLSPSGLAAMIQALAHDPAVRRQQSSKARRLIDGRGAERVAAAIAGLPS